MKCMTRATSRPGRGLRLCIRMFEMQRHDSFVVVVVVVDNDDHDHDGVVVIFIVVFFILMI